MIAMARLRGAAISAKADGRAVALLADLFGRHGEFEALRALLQHFLTKAERAVLARRLEVGVRLASGQSYRMIQEALRVSPNLIRRVDQWLSAERPDYRRLFSIRHRPQRRRAARGRRERSADPLSFDAFLKRFPLWREL